MTLLYSWGWETPIRKTCSDLSKVKWKFKNINLLRSNMRKSEVPPEVKWLDIETKKVSRNFFYICLDFIFANVLQIYSLERNSIICWKIFPFMQLFPPQKGTFGAGTVLVYHHRIYIWVFNNGKWGVHLLSFCNFPCYKPALNFAICIGAQYIKPTVKLSSRNEPFGYGMVWLR